MLSQYFESAFRIHELKDGQAGAQLDSFARQLYESGYAQVTARRHIRAAEHFVFWAGRGGTRISDLTEESVKRFGRHLRRDDAVGGIPAGVQINTFLDDR
jgi:integrase/recombinase XerD